MVFTWYQLAQWLLFGFNLIRLYSKAKTALETLPFAIYRKKSRLELTILMGLPSSGSEDICSLIKATANCIYYLGSPHIFFFVF